mmetsp:Transcript_41819/g.63931  ORF Transcript_41819/g.63931 Transcript_41819/m.63931 type:complete len:100 (+) Transcript_41819:2888-3187(+)
MIQVSSQGGAVNYPLSEEGIAKGRDSVTSPEAFIDSNDNILQDSIIPKALSSCQNCSGEEARSLSRGRTDRAKVLEKTIRSKVETIDARMCRIEIEQRR